MRILHVEGGRHLYGGAFQVLHLLRGLAARGHDNWLACPQGCALAQAAEPVARVCGLPMHGDADLLMAVRLRRLIRATSPDLVHLHSRIGADVMGGLAARLTGVPAIHTRRVDNPEPPWLVALKYRLHDRVIAISEGIGRVLVSEGLPASKLRIVRSAVDWESYARPCDRGTIRARLGVPAETLLIGVIAQLIPRKGHRFLIEALPPLIEAHPNLQVRFFGQGPLATDLQRHLADRGLSGHVQLAGFRDDLAEILPCLDLVVHPVLMEGLGVSLLQTASAGVPIVASRAGGIPEAVREGENGVLVPPGDVPALRAAIGALLADPHRRRALGAGGQSLMAREFSLDAMVEGNLAVYRELISRVV
ncbi:glycosyltransferase family 4 protein [Thiocystis violascens]|uniref:Glycosyltransferase n=1 Tax=Thiocystis violascens (strain ATCC 17096 / DSM 198 / 6111) TaxID=765911 RepID=I3YBQ3_THIV6|nr:glycosyltransferase family 4 protein [Thiocystis violascens]AFL74421.1 glycosyltransferase [Thiocystis violascens DSM 198]